MRSVVGVITTRTPAARSRFATAKPMPSSLPAPGLDACGPAEAPDYCPPARTGMRGNHDGTFTLAHRLRDGQGADSCGDGVNTGESYGLVVVGGGISGLAAAYFFRKDAGKT